MKDDTTTTQSPTAHAPVTGVALLEANLEICQGEIRKLLARAGAIDPRRDEYGHAASAAHGDAMRYLKMSAELGMALAKMKGEHTSIIHVHKTETVLSAPPQPVVPDRHDRPVPVPPPLTPAERAERRARIDKVYSDARARATANGETAAGDDTEDDDAEDDDVEDDDVEDGDVEAGDVEDGDVENEGEEDREEGGPPANFGGSNTSEP